MTTTKPATALHGRRLILQGGYVFEVEHQHAEHIDVLQHRANAYPELVAALRGLLETAVLRTGNDERYAVDSANARALLAKLEGDK